MFCLVILVIQGSPPLCRTSVPENDVFIAVRVCLRICMAQAGGTVPSGVVPHPHLPSFSLPCREKTFSFFLLVGRIIYSVILIFGVDSLRKSGYHISSYLSGIVVT